MIGKGWNKFQALINTKGGTVQSLAFIFGLCAQLAAFLFKAFDFFENPVYLNAIAIAGYLFFVFCWIVALKRKKENDAEGAYMPGESNKANDVHYHTLNERRTATVIIILLGVVLWWALVKINKAPAPLTVTEDNCNAVVTEKSWLNAGAFVKVKSKDTTYMVRVARIIPADNLKAAAEFKGLDCALDISLTPADSIDTLTIHNIAVEVDSYTPLPKYSGETTEKKHLMQDSVLVLTLYDPAKGNNENKKHLKMLAGESIAAFEPMHLLKGETRRLLLRVNADKPGMYSFKIKLGLNGNGRPECEMFAIDTIQWLFIK